MMFSFPALHCPTSLFRRLSFYEVYAENAQKLEEDGEKKRKVTKFKVKYEFGQVVQLQVGLEGLHVQGWELWPCPQVGNQNDKKCDVASRLVQWLWQSVLGVWVVTF